MTYMSLKSREKAKRNRWKRKNFQTDLKFKTEWSKGGKISSTQATGDVQKLSDCDTPELTSGPGSSPWMVRHGVLLSVLSEAAAAQEHHRNVLSYCPSLTKSTPGTWNLECWPAENVWKNKKQIKKSEKQVKRGNVRTGSRLTHAARSCSCSDPGHSQPWWSQSGSRAAPKDIYREHLVLRAPKQWVL